MSLKTTRSEAVEHSGIKDVKTWMARCSRDADPNHGSHPGLGQNSARATANKQRAKTANHRKPSGEQPSVAASYYQRATIVPKIPQGSIAKAKSQINDEI